jgi:ABC-type multidrug transport system fused ATPase/permease subunit
VDKLKSTLRKILEILTPAERRLLWLVFAGVLVAALLETAGVASIVPFLGVIANPNAVQDNDVLHWLFITLGFTSVNWFLLFLGFLSLGALVLSNSMRALVTWGMLRFSWMRNHSLSQRLLESYLHRPYIFFLNENTSTFGRNILMETLGMVTGVLMPALQIIARGMVLIFLLALIIIVNPVLAMVVAVSIGAIYGAIYLFVRRKIEWAGRERMEANALRFKIASEAFGGIKAVKLIGSEDNFVRRYSAHSFQYAKHSATAEVLASLPLYALETVAFVGIILIVLYLMVSRGDLAQVLPLAGLFAFAGYRMMPAMQQIYSGAIQLRFNLAVLDTLHEALQAGTSTAGHRDSRDIEPLPFKDRLEIRGITFKYPQTTEPVINDLSLTIKAGSSMAFAGKTGSGKTTISDIILGLLTPADGSMRVDGVEIDTETLRRWQSNIGYVPQDIYLQDDTIASNIAFGVDEGKFDMAAVERAAKIANIHDFIVGELPDGYNTIVGERGVRLSGGERQRVGIARALYHDPAVLVLDEATSALDGVTEHSVFTAIENIARVKTLIIIAHRLTTVRKCDVIYVIDDGRIIAHGTYDELMATNIDFQKMARAHL